MEVSYDAEMSYDEEMRHEEANVLTFTENGKAQCKQSWFTRNTLFPNLHTFSSKPKWAMPSKGKSERNVLNSETQTGAVSLGGNTLRRDYLLLCLHQYSPKLPPLLSPQPQKATRPSAVFLLCPPIETCVILPTLTTCSGNGGHTRKSDVPDPTVSGNSNRIFYSFIRQVIFLFFEMPSKRT